MAQVKNTKRTGRANMLSMLMDYINMGCSEIEVNYINTDTMGPKITAILEKCGYKSQNPGCPQQTFKRID